MEVYVHFVGGCLLLWSIENAGTLEAKFFDEIQQLLEIFFGLAGGKPTMKGGADTEAGDTCSHAAQRSQM
jgi:hypothetical protein